MTKAYEVGGHSAQCALITPIFRAYYEDDLDICDPEVLADAAEQAAVMSRADVSVPHAEWRQSQKILHFAFFGGTPHSTLILKDSGR